MMVPRNLYAFSAVIIVNSLFIVDDFPILDYASKKRIES